MRIYHALRQLGPCAVPRSEKLRNRHGAVLANTALQLLPEGLNHVKVGAVRRPLLEALNATFS